MDNPGTLVDNAATQEVNTPAAPAAAATTPAAPAAQAPATFSWKSQLATDFANSPTMQKFPDTKEGFNEAVKSHLSLERLLGHEKVPLPKGKDDVEGWSMFKKAMGVPEKPEGYQLEDAKLPDHLKGMTFDKNKFAEVVHKTNATPEQAKELWNAYVQMNQEVYQKAVSQHKEKMTAVINQMRGEWGDAYQSKVELGQMVINKFSDSKEQNDYLNATLSADPQGIKFLAKIGEQFQENKIGDFKYQSHSKTPEEAQKEIDLIRQDPKHPYNNDKATPAERDRAIDYVNSLLGVVSKGKASQRISISI